MRGRRSSRSAAVVLAGCVGLAVMAPGLALAAPVPGVTSEAECTPAVGTWDPVDEVCEAAPAATTTTTEPATDDTVDDGTTTPEPSTSTPSPSTTTTTTTNGVTPPVDTETDDLGTGNPGNSRNEVPGTPAAQGRVAGNEQTPAAPISGAAVTERVLPQVQERVNALIGEGENPLATLVQLPGLPPIIPQPDAGGNFESVNDACLNAISLLQFPDGTTGLEDLSEQLQGFCTTLDPTTVTDLLDTLLGVLQGLLDALPDAPVDPSTIPNAAPHYVPADYWGYWHHQYDVDCPELTYDEANAILAWDPSDPFRLDRDDDGEACENNRHDDDVEYVVYDSYPVGGVATGDGSTDSGASGAEVALAAGALSGLGVTGLALVRRFARQG